MSTRSIRSPDRPAWASLRAAFLAVAAGAITLPVNAQSTSDAASRGYFQELFNDVLRAVDCPEAGVCGEAFGRDIDRVSPHLVPALNRLIARTIASFPLVATNAEFDVVGRGRLDYAYANIGPIYGETAATLGLSIVDAGFNVAAFRLTTLRRVPVRSIHFYLVAADLGGDEVRGDVRQEQEYLDLALQLGLEVRYAVVYFTYGLRDNLDIGVALPLIAIGVDAHVRGVLSDNYRAQFDPESDPYYFFGEPDQLTYASRDSTRSIAGAGDVALRFKYAPALDPIVRTALLLDVRLPTGQRQNFLGTGAANARLLAIAERTSNSLDAYVNAGYQWRGAYGDPHRLEASGGVNVRLGARAALLAGVLASVALSPDRDLDRLAGPESPGTVDAQQIAGYPNARSNMPPRARAAQVLATLGIKYLPSTRLTLLANMLTPIVDDGLRFPIAPTLGLSYNLTW